MGLVNEVVPVAELETTVYALAEEFATNAPLSVKGHKAIVNTLVQRQFDGAALTEADLKTMREAQEAARDSADAVEGRKAFAEKRRPVFLGR